MAASGVHDEADRPAHAGERHPVLLLIDDSPDIHRLLAVKLRDEGLEFLAAFSGEEGLAVAARERPTLILLDLELNDAHGSDVLRELKRDTATMNIPVIILTGTATSASKVGCFELGALDYVVKPFDIPELRARIQSAIRLTRLMRLLEQRAQIDGLSGLWNRAYFDQRLTAELASVDRNAAPLSLVICDLDHFKGLNDRFGHPAGDAVIQGFAAVMSRELRAYDIACRYGGEEFALILPGTPADEARTVCDRVRRALEVSTWPKYPDVHVTASFGITDQGVNAGLEPAAWLDAADRALYAAKGAGRNRVLCFDPVLHGGESARRAG